MNKDSVAGNANLVNQFVKSLKDNEDLINAHLALRGRFVKK